MSVLSVGVDIAKQTFAAALGAAAGRRQRTGEPAAPAAGTGADAAPGAEPAARADRPPWGGRPRAAQPGAGDRGVGAGAGAGGGGDPGAPERAAGVGRAS